MYVVKMWWLGIVRPTFTVVGKHLLTNENNNKEKKKLHRAWKTDNFASVNELLLPTSYLPSIGYIALLVARPSAVIEVCETFPKQTYRNRCNILTSNGVMRLSVPVVRTNGNHTATADMETSYAERWNIQHIRAIESAYNNAPYFLYLWDGLKAVLMKPHKRLVELNAECLSWLLEKLSIECRPVCSTCFIGGCDAVVANSVSQMHFMPYYQVWAGRHGFCANLSVVDLLFNIGPAEARDYLHKCQ